jgi:hypothetical protein
MDYIILSSLSGTKLARVVLSYDIGCQWSKNFSQRMKDFPENLQLHPDVEVEVGIPTWHVNGHGDDCKANFSLGYMHGVGRTCGEDVETTWAQTNTLGTSTREMGPGARHETLNDQWCGLNFRKVVGFREFYSFTIGELSHPFLGSFFLRRFKDAFRMREKHRSVFEQFSSTFPSQTLRKWDEGILEWRMDKSKPNPYKEPASCMFCYVLYYYFIVLTTCGFSHNASRRST